MLLPVAAFAQEDGLIRIEPTPELKVYRSAHYRIFTTLPKAEARPYALHMDALYEQYERRFSGLGEKRVEPMPLYLFSTEQQYDRFLQEHDIDATHSGGMFFVTHKLEGLATWVQAKSRRKTIEVLQHEGFHQFAWHVLGPNLPVWLNEGLAQYFEQAVLTDGRLSLGMTSRPRIEKVRQAIKSGDTLPIVDLMRVTTKQWAESLRKDAEHASLLYAQSWSLTYYLIHGDGGAHQRKLIQYLKQIAAGERSEDAMLMAFGKDGFQKLVGGWRAYALKQTPGDVAEASERLVFLGTGLRVLLEQGEPMPEDLDELRATLKRYGFKLRQREMGVTQSLSAERDDLFRFTRDGGGERDFVMLKPDRAGLPPRITAPGLEPEPTLIWYRDADGKLVQDIAYR